MSANFFDTKAPKKAANLSINSDLLQKAKMLNINISQALEQHLAELVRESLRKQWREENSKAIGNYNERIEQSGVFSDGLRKF
ncbi:MAG TPA: type II toxin-antitoxin system CcdA family antitoxin [Gammaproteobacteria bacterium]